LIERCERCIRVSDDKILFQKEHKMNRLRRFLVVLIVAALTLTAIPRPGLAQDLSGDLTISVESWMVEKYNMEALVKGFQAKHPGVKVKLLTHEGLGANYLKIFLEWAETKKSTADLYFGGLVSQLSPAMIDDQLIPWDDALTGDLAPEKWIQAFLQGGFLEGNAKGSQYPTIPGLGETMDFQVNVEYLKQINKVDGSGEPIFPKTYEEIAAYACDLAKLKVEGKPITGLEMEYGINFAPDTWTAAVVAAEGTYYTEDGKINWDSEAGKKWLEFQKNIVDQKCGGTKTFTDNNGARNGLKASQIAMINASNSRAPEANDVISPDKQKGNAVVRLFPYPGDKGNLAFTHQVYVPRVAANPKAARAFATEMILGQEAQVWSAVNFGKMPTLIANYDALPKDGRDAPNFAQVRKELDGPTQAQWLYKDGQALRQSYVNELQRYLIGEQSLDDTIKNLKAFQDKADLTVPGKKK
jgi:ABC-type glycerol-3-phosphate transport system substrate-binding protein